MPVAIPIVAAAAVAGIGAGIVATSVWVGVAIFAVTVGVGVIAEITKPAATEPQPNQASFVTQARARLESVRQPVTSWRLLYGENRVSGPVVFIETTDNNHRLHMVIVLAAHEIAEIGTVFINDEPIFRDEIGPDGVVTEGKFKDFVRIKRHLGTAAQEADPDLVAETAATSDYRYRGRAYLYIRLAFNPDLFARIPNVSANAKGMKVTDTRAGGAPIWTPNAALCIRDYMLRSVDQGGFGTTAARLDDSWTNASANVADEFVDSAPLEHKTGNARIVDPAGDTLEVDASLLFQTGDRVRVTTDGTLPAGIAPDTDYYVIPWREYEPKPAIMLAASYADALVGQSARIDITDSGAGEHTITKTAEPRYALSGVVETNRRPGDVLNDMRSAMAGKVIQQGGKWSIQAGYWIPPTITLEDDDLRAPGSIRTRITRRERYNAVKGVFVSPQNFSQPADYPIVTNAAYEAEDGDRVIRDIDFPFTTRASAAQRLAKIALERQRQEQTLVMPCKMTAYRLQAGSTVNVDNSRFGFTGKPFEIVDFQLQVEEDDEDVQTMGCNLTMQETAAAVYDWNAGEETVTDPAPDTHLPNPFEIVPPGPPVVTEETYQTRPGAGVKTRAIVQWVPSPDAYVDRYEIHYKFSGDADWLIIANLHISTADVAGGILTSAQLDDLAPGTYDFRIKAINTIGVTSDPDDARTDNVEIRGLLDPPVQLQGLTIAAVGGMAKLRWQQSVDLDVIVGGKIVFRHSPALSGATWGRSTTIGEAVAGAADNATLPLKPGSYLAKAFDSSGVEADQAAVVSTKAAQVLQFAALDFIDEAPLFLGAHNGTVADAGQLKLAGGGLWDDIPDVDALPDVDQWGGIVPFGTYGFAAGIDLGAVKPVRLRSRITALIENTGDLIDSRTDLIDDWADIDGIDAASADAQVWVQETDDDPAGAPAWSAWQRLDAAEFLARGFRAEARLFSYDAVYNIKLSELGLDVDEVV